VTSATLNNPVHPDLRDVVYHTGIRYGDDSNWDFLWEKFLNESVESEKSKLIDALGSTKNSSLLKNFMEETLTLENIRLQDVAQVFRSIGANEPGKRIQFDWLLDNWERVKTSFKERFPEYVISLVC
jgi:aminopeptidase N